MQLTLVVKRLPTVPIIVPFALSLLIFGGCQARPLRTVDAGAGGVPVLCTPGALLPFRLRMDPRAFEPVWGEWAADGTRFEIVWPQGFVLQTQPEPAVTDPHGKVIGRDGELLQDAGGSGGNPVTICQLDGVEYPLTIG